jgi:hypothetical protein
MDSANIARLILNTQDSQIWMSLYADVVDNRCQINSHGMGRKEELKMLFINGFNYLLTHRLP